MRTTITRVTVGVLALGVAGCASLRVNHDHDQQADFSQYSTYSWQDGRATLADNDPLAHQRVIQAIDGQLADKMLSPTESDPDLHVAYHSEFDERIVVDTTHYGYGYGPGWGWGGGLGLSSSTARARTYEEGTLVVDLWDVSANQLVWRGVATDTVSNNPDTNARKIQQAVQQMFRRYPPR